MSSPDYATIIEHSYETILTNVARDPGAYGGSRVGLPPNVPPPPPPSFIQTPPHLPPQAVPSFLPQLIVTTPASQQPSASVRFHEIFLKGKPKALGIVMIVAAGVQIPLGIALIFYSLYLTVNTGIVFWGPIVYICAGSFSIASQPKPNTCLLKSSLGLNIVTSIVSGVGAVLAGVDIANINPFRLFLCGSVNYSINYCTSYTIGVALTSAVLFIDLLLFSISLAISVFGCRSLIHSSAASQAFVMQNGALHPAASLSQPTEFLQPQPHYPGQVIPGHTV